MVKVKILLNENLVKPWLNTKKKTRFWLHKKINKIVDKQKKLAKHW